VLIEFLGCLERQYQDGSNPQANHSICAQLDVALLAIWCDVEFMAGIGIRKFTMMRHKYGLLHRDQEVVNLHSL
jgi:hypothetical protein